MSFEVTIPDGHRLLVDGFIPVQYAPTVPVRNICYRVWTYLNLAYEEDASVMIFAFVRRRFGYAISLCRSNTIGSAS